MRTSRNRAAGPQAIAVIRSLAASNSKRKCLVPTPSQGTSSMERMPSYLEELTLRLAAGIAELPEALRARHATYLLAVQRDDGGFAGREGSSDLYYTGFALRSLAILGKLYGPVAERAAAFLR